jgi:hypothetical protein
MTRLTSNWVTKATLSRAGAGLLLLWVGAACGSSEGASATDAGDNGDRGSTSGGVGASGGGSSSGGGGAADGDSSSGGAGATDGGSAPDGESTVSLLPMNLGTAGNYVILAKSGISNVPTSAVAGNLGLSPAAATYITGFSLTADSTNVFSTSPQVTGKVYAADHATPTPSNLTTAVGDMQTAFTDAAGRAPNVTGLGAGNIGGMTLTPGVYKWATGLLIPTNVTLTGGATEVWIFQIAETLTMSSATSITLAGGAVPQNIFWQVSGSANLGTTAHFEGVILSQTAITLSTGASINGRLLAQTAVTIAGSTVVEP